MNAYNTGLPINI